MEASLWGGKMNCRHGAFAMPFDVPFKLGPFSVDSTGRLAPLSSDTPPVFLFRWHGRQVRARLAQQASPAEGLALLAEVPLGRVPSTAGIFDDTARPRSFALVRWLSRVVPAGWRLRLAPDHRIWLDVEAPIGQPITAAALLTRITCFAMELGPFLDLMDETGVTA
jgi:hypothetical protein